MAGPARRRATTGAGLTAPHPEAGGDRPGTALVTGSAGFIGYHLAARLLEDEIDAVVCLHAPEDFGSTGRWYDDFTLITDDQVIELAGICPGCRRAAG